LVECIDRGLLVLGETPKKAVYYHLEKKSHVKKDEIPEKLEDFILGIRQIFGSGASLIEKRIIEELSKELDVPIEENCSDLLESVRYILIKLTSMESRRT